MPSREGERLYLLAQHVGVIEKDPKRAIPMERTSCARDGLSGYELVAALVKNAEVNRDTGK